MSMNLRQLARIDEPYFQLDREERHLAGILFHLLNYKDNVALALQSVEAGWNINPAEFGVYLEYSYPRDLWNKMEVKDGGRNGAESNKHKRDVIIEMLGSQGFDTSKLASRKQVKDFNSFFIEAPRPSSLYIQSPANWSLAQIADSL